MEQEKEPSILELNQLEKEMSLSQDFFSLNDSIKIYFRDIGLIKLLTREEEIELAKLIAIARDSTDDNVVKQGKEARDKLIEANLRLVVNIALKFTYSNHLLKDLIQEGNMGLMRAVDKFDYNKGFKFSTYATWWITQSVTRSISKLSSTIHYPVHFNETMSLVKSIKRKYVNEYGVVPSIETLSQITKISTSTLKMIELYNNVLISLDNPNDDNCLPTHLMKDTINLNPEEYEKFKELEEYVNKILQELDERERMIVKMRFGINCEEKSLGEIGQVLGITRERVRQIEKRALSKLRKIVIT